jgi:hypothetical protein
MATAHNSSSGRSTKSGAFVRGRSVAVLGRGMELVKVGKTAKPKVKRADAATVLVRKAARALSKPGIRGSVVFRGPNPSKVYAYSAYPQDPTRIVRTSSDGTRVIGRLVNGRFRATKS